MGVGWFPPMPAGKYMLKSHNQSHPQTLTPWLGTGTEKVDHVEMVTDVNKDLEFRHEGSVFTVCCSFCRYRTKKATKHVGLTL